MKGEIELTGMKFKGYHGVLDFERRGGNLFMVDFKCTMDLSKAAESDDIADTVDYGVIYDLAAAEMIIPSNLLENVCGRIVKAIAARYPQLDSFSVKVSKQHPPVNGEAQWSSVTLYHGE